MSTRRARIGISQKSCASNISVVIIKSPSHLTVGSFNAGAVLPNWSFNRTLCGGPSLGSKILAQTRPAAKCRLTRTLGRRLSDTVPHQRLRIQVMERHCSFNADNPENQTLREHANPSETNPATRRWQERSGTNRQPCASAARAGNELLLT